jgi:hypothetical protein
VFSSKSNWWLDGYQYSITLASSSRTANSGTGSSGTIGGPGMPNLHRLQPFQGHKVLQSQTVVWTSSCIP